MTLRPRLGALLGATILLVSSALAGYAQTSGTDTSSVDITTDATTNYLAVQITAADFEARPYSFENQTTTGSVTLAVTDTRGTAPGWGVNVAGSNFTSGTESFEIGNLALAPQAPIAVTGACGVVTSAGNQTVVPLGIVTSTAQRIWSADAASGAGCFQLPVAATLNIPGGTLVGTYTSTVTVSITAAP
jgi:hypothetical protein